MWFDHEVVHPSNGNVTKLWVIFLEKYTEVVPQMVPQNAFFSKGESLRILFKWMMTSGTPIYDVQAARSDDCQVKGTFSEAF